MPAYISISNKEKNWLKKLLEEQFQISINNSYACKQLSILISKNNHYLLSYNTLRRLFDIVDSKSKPSEYTLNILASSVGFVSYSDFKTYIYKFDTDIINELIITFYEQKKIDTPLIMHYFQNFIAPSWQEVYQLKNIVDLCIKTSSIVCLKSIVHIPFNPKTEEFLEKFTICFQELYFQARDGNKKLNHFILVNIPTSEILQRILLQVYIREDQLTSFWGGWIESATLGLVEDMPVFKNIFLCQKMDVLKANSEAKRYLQKAKNYFKTTDVEIHPILIGRMAAWEIILNGKEKFAEAEIAKIKTKFGKTCFMVFFYRLLYTYNQNNKNLDLVETVTFNKLPIALGAFDKKIFNKFFLILAFHYHNKKMNEKCSEALSIVDPLRLDSWESDWFSEKYKHLYKLYLN